MSSKKFFFQKKFLISWQIKFFESNYFFGKKISKNFMRAKITCEIRMSWMSLIWRGFYSRKQKFFCKSFFLKINYVSNNKKTEKKFQFSFVVLDFRTQILFSIQFVKFAIFSRFHNMEKIDCKWQREKIQIFHFCLVWWKNKTKKLKILYSQIFQCA